jgi:hypothetical protein
VTETCLPKRGNSNEYIFDQLVAHKEAIDDSFGESLDWERLEGNRACRVRKRIEIGGYQDEPKWPEVHHAMIEAVIRLEKALGPYIDKLDIPAVIASENIPESTAE